MLTCFSPCPRVRVVSVMVSACIYTCVCMCAGASASVCVRHSKGTIIAPFTVLIWMELRLSLLFPSWGGGALLESQPLTKMTWFGCILPNQSRLFPGKEGEQGKENDHNNEHDTV